MRWSAALSEAADHESAAREVTETVRGQLDGPPDLLLLFASPHHAAAWNELARAVAAAFPGCPLVGCSGAGVIGDAHEVEQRRAVSLVAARLPGVRVHPFAVAPTSWPDDDDDPAPRAAWCDHLELPPDLPVETILLFPEPFGGQAERLVAAFGRAFPEAVLLGGVAGGAPFPGGSALFLGGRAIPLGAVGVVLSGAIEVVPIVSQGCRPVGPPLLVTKAAGTEIHALGERPPREVLREIYEGLEPAEQELFRRSLFVGVEAEPERVQHQDGAWLVRNIRGVDVESGALAIAARVEPWQVVQFLVRDAHAADVDLRARLQSYRAALPVSSPDDASPAAAAVLMFTCAGRGLSLFGRPDHDVDRAIEVLGDAPLGGVFCSAEIGPVGSRAFVHGFTTVLGVIRARPAAPAPAASGRARRSAKSK